MERRDVLARLEAVAAEPYLGSHESLSRLCRAVTGEAGPWDEAAVARLAEALVALASEAAPRPRDGRRAYVPAQHVAPVAGRNDLFAMVEYDVTTPPDAIVLGDVAYERAP